MKTKEEKIIFELIRNGFSPDEAINYITEFPNFAEDTAKRMKIQRSKTPQQFRYGEGNVNEL